jgi:WD40 repeat protein
VRALFEFSFLIGVSVGAIQTYHEVRPTVDLTLPKVHLFPMPTRGSSWDQAIDYEERYLMVSSARRVRQWKLTNLTYMKRLRRGAMVLSKKFTVISLANSPDGHDLAIGGFLGRNSYGNDVIFVFDYKRRKFRRSIHLGGLPANLTYSPDGRSLAFGAPNESGEAGVLDVASGKWAWFAKDLLGEITALAFAKDGRIVVSASNWEVGYNRIAEFDRVGLRLAIVNRPIRDRPGEIRFSPDGKELVMTSRENPSLTFLDSETLAQKASLSATDLAAPSLWNKILCCAWSPDGKSVYAAGNGRDSSGTAVVRRWDRTSTGWSDPHDVPIGTTMIVSLVPLPKGEGVAFFTQNGFGYFLFHAEKPSIASKRKTKRSRHPYGDATTFFQLVG